MSFQLPSYLEGDADLVPLRDPDQPEIYDEEKFSRAALSLSRRLSNRSNRQELVQKNIIKGKQPLLRAINHLPEEEGSNVPGTINNANNLSVLSRRLSNRPSVLDLKLRNILRTDSTDNVANPNLEKSLDFEGRKKTLKGCLKKRPEKNELVDHNIITPGDVNADPSLPRRKLSVKHTQIKDTLDVKLRGRPNFEEPKVKKIINFNQTVEVYSTFKKQEYNRKPDENATFKKLTPQMKVQIREELNTFKMTEMEVHEDSAHNTCYH